MLEPPEPRYDVEEWLAALRLSQYISFFHKAGYFAVNDCRGLTDERLLELKILPTGHRKRILRSLEALGLKQQQEDDGRKGESVQSDVDQNKPPLFPRHIFLKDRRRDVSYQQNQPKDTGEYSLEGSQSLPAGAELASDPETLPDRQNVIPPVPAPRNLPCMQTSVSPPACVPTSILSSSSNESLPTSEIPSDWEASSGEQCYSCIESVSSATDALLPVLTGDQEDFLGEMVENSIYESVVPRLTRSYRLRHRPVPEIPNETDMAPLDRSAQTTSPEHLTSSERPTGANGIKKAPLQRTLTPIAPYGEIFLYNQPGSSPEKRAKDGLQKGFKDKMKQKKKRKKPIEKECPSAPSVRDKDGYSTLNMCASVLPRAIQDPAFSSTPDVAPVSSATPDLKDEPMIMVDCDLYSESVNSQGTESIEPDISPYACFYGAPKQAVKVGWLDKLSPQGNCVFQRRWMRFDGESLGYYNNEKEMYSKGLILVSAIRQLKGLGDNKFEVVTGLRTFTFRAEKEGERQEWMETLQTAMRPPASSSQKRSDSLLRLSSTNKRGLLELRGYKGRVLVSLVGSKVRLCKTEQDFRAGLGICEVELTAANIKEVDRRGFEINTPFKNFCFVADSEGEKEEWVEAIKESIAETLCDYEVAEKIWFNEANRSCADCGASQPEWASVNLGVVICKKCAGQHRSLGPSLSKVRSLKLDSSIWSNELVELFLEVGNNKANSFWAANLPLEEELYSGASTEQRASFIRRKYRERKYRKVLEEFSDLEELNRELCAAVVLSDVLHTMELVFSGADVMCATGDPDYSTPYLLAQRAGQKLQMEFLHQNKLSDFPRLDQWSENASLSDVSFFMDGFLYVSSGPAKTMPDRRGRDDMVRRWCTLEGGFLSYYENERSAVAIGRVDVTEVVSLAVSDSETMTGAGRAVFTVELYLRTERALTVGVETQDTQHDWIEALTKCFVPSKVERLVQKDSKLIGRLQYKEGHDLYHWRTGWFMLKDSALHFSSGDEEGEEEVLHLKQLQELTVSTHTEGEDKIQVLLMVESGRTIYIHGFNRMDFSLWHSAITLAAGTHGRALGDQQLTKNGVPIIVDSCIAFVTQYGLCQEGVYQTPGDPARVSLLLEEFTRDARNVKLRNKEHQLEDVTDTLKSYLSQTEDALLTKELYPYWVSALDEKEEKQRVKKYSTFIDSLPKIYRSTLHGLLQHLYRIQQCSHLNGMPSEKLATVFSSCLFQTQGQTPQEISVVRDLISNYVTLFSVNEEQVQQMETENSFITRWNEKKDTAFCPAGDLIFEVYLEKREPEQCCLIKLSPNMRSSELAETALNMRNRTFNAEDLWTTFEVIENGELERPLHQSEKILEQVLEWSTLDCPSSAFLVIKKFVGAKRMAGGKDPRQFLKSDYLKFSDGSSKLLSGHKFQDKYVVLRSEKLLLYRDIKNTKAEKEIQLKMIKCYLGLKKKLKPPTNWGFTVYTDKHQWHFCCDRRETQISWVADIIALKHGSDFQRVSTSKETGDLNISKGGAITGTSKVPPYNYNFSTELKDRRVSLGEVNLRTTNVSDAPLKTHTIPKCLKPGARAEATEVSPRRTSVDICLTQRLPPPSLPRHMKPMPLPVLPQTGNKTPSKKPIPVSGAGMPPNLLNELNLVLSKTARKSTE